jgi:hypothetical protein
MKYDARFARMRALRADDHAAGRRRHAIEVSVILHRANRKNNDGT